jgi:hypothetical protein
LSHGGDETAAAGNNVIHTISAPIASLTTTHTLQQHKNADDRVPNSGGLREHAGLVLDSIITLKYRQWSSAAAARNNCNSAASPRHSLLSSPLQETRNHTNTRTATAFGGCVTMKTFTLTGSEQLVQTV